MSTTKPATPAAKSTPDGVAKLLRHYGCGPVGFTGTNDALYERRLVFDHVINRDQAGAREQFEAIAAAIRDVLTQRWVKTTQEYDHANPKQVYYLSMEFLIGRSLENNVENLLLGTLTDAVEEAKGLRVAELEEQEPDAGLGNGGLGRLAACFIDSMATLQIPAIGYGLRYDYGIFRQELENGYQVEHPDPWLTRPDPWEVARPNEQVLVPLASTFETHNGQINVHRGQPMSLLGVPYDRPVVGYGGKTINTHRLLRDVTHEHRRTSLTELIAQANKAWHGVKLNQPDWGEGSRSIAFGGEIKKEKLSFHLILNGYWEPLDFELPLPTEGKPWRRWIDTSLPSPQDIVEWKASPFVPGNTYGAGPRSVVMLFSGVE